MLFESVAFFGFIWIIHLSPKYCIYISNANFLNSNAWLPCAQIHNLLFQVSCSFSISMSVGSIVQLQNAHYTGSKFSLTCLHAVSILFTFCNILTWLLISRFSVFFSSILHLFILLKIIFHSQMWCYTPIISALQEFKAGKSQIWAPVSQLSDIIRSFLK